jgi:tetratricopeptide (TPR) repeat protein
MMLRVLLVLVALSLFADRAYACWYPANCDIGIPPAAAQAFANGDYLRAASIAESNGSPRALAFSARAHTAYAVSREILCGPCLVEAEAKARAAIEADPMLADAYVQLAVAMGLRGRLLDSIEAQSEGLAEKGRAALDRALELDPQNAWARASLGGWHLEIVRRAGPVLASTLFGASKSEGLRNFRAALAQDLGNGMLRYHFALSVLALDVDEHHDEARTALAWASESGRHDAMMKLTRERALHLLRTLKTGTNRDVFTLVRKYQGYPPES